ncbi:MAG: cytochrome c3 family protein [Bacteroidia bacterium]|nr:cytochrome c3 family protein [Bacteroidia bacterium]
MQSSFLFLLILLFLGFSQKSQAQEKSLTPENDKCLKCHTHQTFTFQNTLTKKEDKRMSNPLYILDKNHFAAGVHAKFKCTDCHSSAYSTYPHNAELKLEPLSTCLDCHGGDEKYAAYQFEKIEKEFQKSVHFQKSGESFTCSKCHNQHYYQAKSRTSSVVGEIIGFSNEMCMTCHSNNSKFQLLSDTLKPALSQIHGWLPNQELHFKNVRCIECHTQVVDSLSVSHNILPKEKALKNCVECHSKNSMLVASLYKYKNLQSRSEGGKLNTIIANKSYVIGAYQNFWLNNFSIFIFIMALAGICIHVILRIIKK